MVRKKMEGRKRKRAKTGQIPDGGHLTGAVEGLVARRREPGGAADERAGEAPRVGRQVVPVAVQGGTGGAAPDAAPHLDGGRGDGGLRAWMEGRARSGDTRGTFKAHLGQT